MSASFAVRRRAATCAALATGVFAFARAASPAALITSADLRYDRGSDFAMWGSSLAIASPASEFGLPPVALRAPAVSAGASIPHRDQIALQVRTGPGPWHGALTELRADARRFAGGERREAWLSLGAGAVAGGDGAWIAPLLGIGGSARWQRIRLIAQLDQTPGYTGGRAARTTTYTGPDPDFPESLTVNYTLTEPAEPGAITTITRLQVRAAFESGRIALEAAGGTDVRSGSTARRWLRGGASVAVLPAVSMFASYGGAPSQLFVAGSPGRPRAAVGVRVAPAPRIIAASRRDTRAVESWRLEPAGEDRYRFSLRVPGARTVELMGDMTDWQPLALERKGAAGWVVTLAMTRGVHHVLVRVDGGEWTVPPRMTGAASEFAGTVGVLVVE